jgi:hypothetical protein
MGYGIIQNPLYNKGTAFSYPERDRLGLRGLLPPRRISMPLQMRQAMERMKALPTDIDRYEVSDSVPCGVRIIALRPPLRHTFWPLPGGVCMRV